MNFYNPFLHADSGFCFDIGLLNGYFASFDTTKALVLGNNSSKQINFLKIPFKQGNIFLNLQPLAFTNYHILYSGKPSYANHALAYLPEQNIIWDEYYKPGKVSGSPIRYILSQPPLKAAYMVLFFSLLIYLVFEFKRKQRPVPFIKPLDNKSMEFVKTLGSLYFHKRDNKSLALKKHMFFRDFIKSKFYLKPDFEDEKQIDKIARKTGIEIQQYHDLQKNKQKIANSRQISDKQLIDFNKLIENLYQQIKNI